MTRGFNLLISISLIFMLVGCQSSANRANKADVIYYGGSIITMEGDTATYVEALAVKDGKILYVGEKAEAEKMKDSQTQMKDLEGKTLLPGFIDAHSHLATAMNIMGQANVSSPPVGNCADIDGILQELKKFKADNNIKDGEWIFGWGYDDTQLKEKRHPNKTDLDKEFPNNPVFLQHVSGHMGVANSLALKEAKIDDKTPDPAGGLILRMAGSQEPSGVVQEMATHQFVEIIAESFADKMPELLQKTLNEYASNGMTTIQEGFSDEKMIDFLRASAKEGKLSIDVVALPNFLIIDKYASDTSTHWRQYDNHLKLEGVKIISDGSPQGKTAFFTKPYLTDVPGCTHDCKGFPNLTQEQMNTLFVTCYKNNIQVFIHCNGDASMDMALAAHEEACKTLNQPLDTDRRTIIIHSNFVRQDQLEKYKKYNIIPSFFTNHAYFWGDVHILNLGLERASFLSPLVSAEKLGLRYTNHTDYNITPLSQLFTVWTAVNRLTRSGIVIGENERTSPYKALQAVTINGAYEYFEEDRKGSLKEGKLADFVILDNDPLKVDPLKISEIKVEETIKEGKTVFLKEKN